MDAAEAVHTDMKKGFIRAEVLAYDDLMAAGTYAEARKKGTVRLEGADLSKHGRMAYSREAGTRAVPRRDGRSQEEGTQMKFRADRSQMERRSVS